MGMEECFCRGRNKDCRHCNGFGLIRPDLSPPIALIYPSRSRSKNNKQFAWRGKTKSKKKKKKIQINVATSSLTLPQASISKETAIVDKAMEALKAENYLLAKEIWTQESDAGNPRAQAALGLLYYKGLGVEKNLEESFRWFLESAKNDLLKGQVAVANMYFKGLGVSRDFVSAYIWARLASRSGNEKAKEIGRAHV